MSRILIVDDSETVRILLKKDLSAAGYQVFEGVDGEDGLNVLTTNADIKLIICDFNMPKMDGLTMCKAVQNLEDYKHIPRIMLTTEFSGNVKAEAKAAGIIAWILKPYDPAKVMYAVGKIVPLNGPPN